MVQFVGGYEHVYHPLVMGLVRRGIGHGGLH
jgi:hypothetical protein